MINFCFVIQPFNKDSFNKLFEDIYSPAIQAANLEAYRVDKDVNVRVPIEDIESKIKESTICFADISEDNPNVWYELGFAFACGKDVVMICSEERKEFPFDIRHKQIIKYKTESPRDFHELKEKITAKISAFLASNKREQIIVENPIKEQDGLKDYELSFLFFAISNQISDEALIPLYSLLEKMNKAGYNDAAVSIAVRKLVGKGYLTTGMDSDWNNNEFLVCSLTPKGVSYIMDNENLFELKLEKVKVEVLHNTNTNDLPF